MIDFNFNMDCSGCGACFNACPVNAIKMVENNEGFLIPAVDEKTCINCGKCDKVCSHLNGVATGGSAEAVWIYCSSDDEAKKKSSSGAACYELGKKIINTGGFVAGCIFDDELRAVHDIGNDEAFLKRTQGSKYVQSNTRDVYSKVIEKLKEGEEVLFTGTPCQATGMHKVVMNTCSNYRDNLITLGVICHGVASPLVWKSFKSYSEKKEGSRLVSVNFRDKTKEGYKKSYCYYEYADGRSTYLPTYLPSSKYIEATLVYNLAIRNSCSHCDCKGINQGIDLVVGDWYAEYKGEGKLGTSCIVAFTERGKLFAENSLHGLRNIDYSMILEKNSFIENSIKESPNRGKFFERILDDKYWDRVEELYPPKYKYKKLLVKLGLFDIIKRIVG